ncbi:MAG: hypothetical protein V9E94_09710 [Microthrixaceae bacterium]
MLTVTATVGAAGCSFGDDEPATVTVPRSNTSTTTIDDSVPPDSVGPSPDAEPLPVAWIAQVGGPGDDRLRGVAGWDAEVVAVGDTAGLDAQPTIGGTDALVALVSTGGEVRVATSVGSDGDDLANGVAADLTATTCGSSTGALASTSAGRTDAWCAQLDRNGQLVAPSQLGAADDESATGVGTSPDIGSSYVSGTASGVLPGAQDPSGGAIGGGDALMMQVDDAGRPVWARQFGSGLLDAALGVTGVPDGDGIVVGFTDGDLEGPTNGGRDAFISRFDPSGNQRWVTQIGSAGSDVLRCVAVTGEARRGDLRFAAAGTTDGDVDLDGPAVNAGMNDALVASFAPNGALSWITQFGSAADESVGGVASDGATLYVVGTTGDDFGDLVDGGGVGGGRDGFLAALDVASGSVLWVSRFGSAGDEEIAGLTITEDGLLVASGTTSGQVGETASAGGLDGFLIVFPLAAAGGGAASSV